MRWVTVASDEGPRACGVVQWAICRCQRGRSRDAVDRARALASSGPEWQRRAWDALAQGSRPARSRQRDAAGTRARPAEDRLHRAELSRPRGRERRAGADRAGAFQQIPVRPDRPRCSDRLAQSEPGGRLRGRAGDRDRPQGAAYSAAASPRACRRLRGRPRRLGPRLAAQQAGQAVDGRQDV